jgi:hypothetical protein
MKPKRIQRKRTKGWNVPENTVYVGRPSRWGNKFKVGNPFAAAGAVTAYEAWLLNSFSEAERQSFLAPLRGKNLACWCRLDEPCHADILLDWANRGQAVRE